MRRKTIQVHGSAIRRWEVRKSDFDPQRYLGEKDDVVKYILTRWEASSIHESLLQHKLSEALTQVSVLRRQLEKKKADSHKYREVQETYTKTLRERLGLAKGEP